MAGGPGGAGGYNFQAQATALVYSYVLAGQPLTWVPGVSPVPLAVAAETGGPGDDMRVECEGDITVEVQAKSGLRRTKELWKAIVDLVRGLSEDPSLHGVLLVDHGSSGSVKKDLREDVDRLAHGRDEGLKNITVKLLKELRAADIEDLSVLRRFAIVVRDLYEGSEGHENAVLMLAKVADNPGAAWDALERDGHALMENRGRRDAEALVSLLRKRDVALSAKASEPAVVAQIYRDSMIAKTSEFYVPGAGVSLPISKAWTQLEAHCDSKHGERTLAQNLEEWIASRREWERLGLRESWIMRDRTTFDADRVVLAGHRTVIVSGPGGGKSTLQIQLANRLSLEGKNVCYVRLPLVADRMEKGKETFREALLKRTADNSGQDESKLAAVLEHPDYLLVDGLDECDPLRATVAKELSSWANNHPRSAIVATTRPAGHNAGLLPGWRHLELLPLDEDAARQHASNILEKLGEDPNTLDEFWDLVKENQNAARAAGNPLLLGFLLRLFVDGVPFGQRRNELYGQIVRQIRDREPRRGHTSTALDLDTADRALEIVGWLLQPGAVVSKEEVTEKLARELASELDILILPAKRTARECLNFWEDRGILERVTVGSREAVMFVHAALGEYSAGRYASGFDDGKIGRWVTNTRRDPRWREILLLASGARTSRPIVRPIVEVLLDLYDPEDPVGEELELAARALTESPEPPTDLTNKVMEALRERLTGDIPSVIFGAAESALGVARDIPDVVGPAVESLSNHPQFATRLAATRLLLECGAEHVNLDALERVMEELLLPNEGEYDLPQRRGIGVWSFQDQILQLGVKYLLRSRPEAETMSLVERVTMLGPTSVGAHSSLAQFLDEEGYEELAEKAAKGSFYTPRRSRIPWDREKWRRIQEEDIAEDRTFLKLVLDTVGDIDEAAEGQPEAEPEAIASLIHGMGMLEYVAGSWDLMLRGDDPDAVRAVLRGGIKAVGLDVQQLAVEAAGQLQALDNVDLDRQSYCGLLRKLPRVPVEARWERAADLDLRADVLVRALRHPSVAVAGSAAHLIAHGAGAPRAKYLLAGALEGVPEHTYECVALLAPRVWAPDEAIKHLSAALEDGITMENRHLLGPLTELPEAQGDKRVMKALLAGIWSEDPRIATDVAEATLNPDSPVAHELKPQLEEALEHWTKRGTSCEKHGGVLHGDESCPTPKCRTIPPSPRAALIRFLGEADRLDFERLTALCTDGRSDVREVAAKLVANKVAGAEALANLLGQVGTGELPLAVLREVLALPPAWLHPVKEELVGLLASRSAEVRETVVGALPTPGWLNPVEATSLATTALEDQDSGVRDCALKVLRTLERA
jgi:hypothetical protein